jgi:chromosomal replication initiation ATPase DnaA
MIIQTLTERNRLNIVKETGRIDNITKAMISRDIIRFDNRRISTTDIESIELIVCDQQGMDKDVLHMPSRKREIVQCRQLVYYFAHDYTDKSLANIGAYFNQDHATVLHGINSIAGLKENNKHIKQDVEEIKDKLDLIGYKIAIYPKQNGQTFVFSDDPANELKLKGL